MVIKVETIGDIGMQMTLRMATRDLSTTKEAIWMWHTNRPHSGWARPRFVLTTPQIRAYSLGPTTHPPIR